MKKTTKIVSMLALILMLAWITPSFVHAQAPSVNDCLKNQSNCDSSDSESNPGVPSEEQEEAPVEQVSDEGSGNLFLNFLKLIFALGIVLALIYSLLKIVNRKNKKFLKHRTLENLGGITLGAQKSMQVVRIGNQYYVVGVGENIELLTEITDKKTIDELLDKEGIAEFNPASLVTSLIGKKKSEEGATEKKQSEENFSNIFKKELSMLKSGRKQSIARFLNKGDEKNE